MSQSLTYSGSDTAAHSDSGAYGTGRCSKWSGLTSNIRFIQLSHISNHSHQSNLVEQQHGFGSFLNHLDEALQDVLASRWLGVCRHLEYSDG